MCGWHVACNKISVVIGTQIARALRQHGWALNLLFVALGSYFVASAVNAVVARHIREVPSLDDLPAPTPRQSASEGPQRQALSALAERNLLALKRENLGPATESSGQPSAVSGRDFTESELQPCSISSTLRATIVADQPEWSMALLVNNASRDPQMYTINEGGNQIADDAYLVAIRSREVVVRRRDHFERCSGEGDLPAPNAPTPVVSAYGDEPPPPIPGDMTGVTKLSETDYRVDRAEVDRALGNLNEVATQARLVPSFKNGKPNGFKIFSIRSGSIYAKIGLQNGDVILKINGFEMNSPDRALEVYTKLRDATSLTIETLRRGQQMTMNYAIR